MTPGRVWRRTAVNRNGPLVRFPDDWSLIDAASGLAIARIHAEPDGGWRCVCRSIIEGELKDSIMAWFKTGKEAKVTSIWGIGTSTRPNAITGRIQVSRLML